MCSFLLALNDFYRQRNTFANAVFARPNYPDPNASPTFAGEEAGKR